MKKQIAVMCLGVCLAGCGVSEKAEVFVSKDEDGNTVKTVLMNESVVRSLSDDAIVSLADGMHAEQVLYDDADMHSVTNFTMDVSDDSYDGTLFWVYMEAEDEDIITGVEFSGSPSEDGEVYKAFLDMDFVELSKKTLDLMG